MCTGYTVGRMGGDEFVDLLTVAGDEDPAAVGSEVERIIRAVGEPLILGAVVHAIIASIGICVAQPDDPAPPAA